MKIPILHLPLARTILLAILLQSILVLAQAQSTIGGVNLGNLPNYHMVFTDGRDDANWQGASKGFVGDVAIDGIQASERTSGSFAYAGTIYTNDATLGAWQAIVDNNPGQAFASYNQTTRIANLTTDLENVFTQVNALPVTAGYANRLSTSLNGLNTQNGIAETFVINITSGFGISSQINITGDAGDIYILRWDTDQVFSNGYQGQVKFQSGGAIVPLGGLKATNFIHVAGEISSSGGGSTPTANNFPQGPRLNDGQGALITNAQDFSGGGFFTGYWFTTGDPTLTDSGQPYGQQTSLSNGIFVGGWYSKNTKFSMTSGTSGVYVSPPCSISATLTSRTICSGQTASLTATGGSSYTLSPGNQTNTTGIFTVSPTSTTNYTVVASTGSSCSATATGTVTVNPLPTPTLSSTAICAGQTATLTATGGTSYTLVNTGAVNTTGIFQVSPTATTSYTVRAANAAGCTATATGTVTVNPAPTPTLSSTAICAGQTATLTATGGTSYTLVNTNAVNTTGIFAVSPTATTNYTVIASNATAVRPRLQVPSR